MKQEKTIFVVLIVILICCSFSTGQPSNGIGINGNVGAVPIGLISNGAHVFPNGEVNSGAKSYLNADNGANTSLPLREFQCHLMSACGIYDPAKVSNDAIVNIGAVGSGAIVNLGGV
jgi:hypothetical protein